MIITKENFFELIQQIESIKNGSIILIDKPRGWTSFDVVNKIKRTLEIRKVGHTGTLDPFATGLLILLIEKFTKKQNLFTNLDKTYLAKVKLGATTITLDPTTEEINIQDISHIKISDIEKAIKSFEGEYDQIPPMFSAKKISGQRLYKIAREGKTIELKPNKVKIYSINIIDISLPFVSIEVDCSKGTYIRSLARDIGKTLDVPAYLFELRRKKIGKFSVDNALSIYDFLKILGKDKANENILRFRKD